MKNNLGSMSREDLETTCETMIDSLLTRYRSEKIPAPRDAKRDRNPESASEIFKKDGDLWPKCVDEKYPDAFLHAVGKYVYARIKINVSKEEIDKPISHFVWDLYHGKMPYKGRRLMHVNGDTRDNNYKNLHPENGVYE